MSRISLRKQALLRACYFPHFHSLFSNSSLFLPGRMPLPHMFFSLESNFRAIVCAAFKWNYTLPGGTNKFLFTFLSSFFPSHSHSVSHSIYLCLCLHSVTTFIGALRGRKELTLTRATLLSLFLYFFPSFAKKCSIELYFYWG